jgi:hypothetical protein
MSIQYFHIVTVRLSLFVFLIHGLDFAWSADPKKPKNLKRPANNPNIALRKFAMLRA